MNLRFFFLLSLLSMLLGCSESYKQINPAKFNRKLAERTDIRTPEELVRLYYNCSECSEKNQSIEVELLGNDSYEITLIQSKLDDDSAYAEKVVLHATRKGNSWTVQEIRLNWKCLSGRGHTGWGNGDCD